jgi:phage terminase large subunit GpA-like protein
MARAAAHSRYLVLCPHCRKEFEGELLEASQPTGPRGFKCIHCRLFVPFDRANASTAT